MRILLTGGTGFIGSHFLNQALAAGHEVLALRRSLTSTPRIKLDSQPQWIDAQFYEVSADYLKNCDVLVHLAAHTGNVPYDTLLNCLRWNLIEVIELFEQARQAGVRRFVVAGSCFEYGRSAERYDAIPTDAPLEPTNSYAASKAAASVALSQWANEHQLCLEILRVFHVFGEGEVESRFWPSLRRAALSGKDFSMTAGEQIRDFQPVKNVASMFLERALDCSKEKEGSMIYNLSTKKQSTILNFAKYWWKELGAIGSLQPGTIPYRDSEVMRYIPKPGLLIC